MTQIQKRSPRRRHFVLIAILALASAAFGFFLKRTDDHDQAYRTVTVERGNVDIVVSATGTLEPVTTVEVGTQVSGKIDEILVDFNDTVEAGQVIARLDTTLLNIAVRESRANLKRMKAEYDKADREYRRISALAADGITSDSDLDAARDAFDVASANLDASQVSLDRSEQNLAYATITAPISGVVVERNVDVGQTVASSLQAPQLMLIAASLGKMQIMVSVDESDIGLIHEGQTAQFTVQAYPDDTFESVVKQVRLQSITEENVVNYRVVVAVENEDGRLLPGMTATVDFLVNRATDVLKVANAALRFRPTESMVAQLRGARGRRPTQHPTAQHAARPETASRRHQTLLFFLDDQGNLSAAPVTTGLSDGQFTEIHGPPVIKEGLNVIAGVTRTSESTSWVSNPFRSQSNANRRPMGPPPGM